MSHSNQTPQFPTLYQLWMEVFYRIEAVSFQLISISLFFFLLPNLISPILLAIKSQLVGNQLVSIWSHTPSSGVLVGAIDYISQYGLVVIIIGLFKMIAYAIGFFALLRVFSHSLVNPKKNIHLKTHLHQGLLLTLKRRGFMIYLVLMLFFQIGNYGLDIFYWPTFLLSISLCYFQFDQQAVLISMRRALFGSYTRHQASSYMAISLIIVGSLWLFGMSLVDDLGRFIVFHQWSIPIPLSMRAFLIGSIPINVAVILSSLITEVMHAFLHIIYAGFLFTIYHHTQAFPFERKTPEPSHQITV